MSGEQEMAVARRCSNAVALLVGASLVATPVSAGILPFESTLSFLAGIGAFDSLEAHGFLVTGSDTGIATLNGSGGGAHLTSLQLPAGAVAAQGLYPFSDPQSFPFDGVAIDASNQAGMFSGGPFGGSMALDGTAKICMYSACTSAPVVNLSVPLSLVGKAGTHALVAPNGLGLTVVGAPWTTGTVNAGTINYSSSYGPIVEAGYAHGPASQASSTAQPGGVVSLVTPTFIRIGVGTGEGGLVLVTRMTIEFVPEPDTFFLIGAGAVLLGVGARRRHTSRIVKG